MKDALYTTGLNNADRHEALAEIFRRMRDESRENAERAKRLLVQRVAE